jgi:Asp-tRNA(Asn)/Glu-tRNA(Gln) amidotransferase C subunit
MAVLQVAATRYRLALSDADLSVVTVQLEGLLTALEQLNALDIESVEPTTDLVFEEDQLGGRCGRE